MRIPYFGRWDPERDTLICVKCICSQIVDSSQNSEHN
jgi:hypothetical protein